MEDAEEMNPAFKLASPATLKVEEAESGAATWSEPAIVEEPTEIKALLNMESPETVKVLEADNGPASCKELAMVEEAEAIKPVPIVSISVVEALVTVRVPVAVTLATLVMLPENKALPWTERSWDGEVVPMPNKPVSANRPASLKIPEFKIEKASMPLAGS